MKNCVAKLCASKLIKDFTWKKWLLPAVVLGVLLIGKFVLASDGSGHGEEVEHGIGVVELLGIAAILLAAKLSSLVEKIGQPSVLGELVIGVILGNLALVGIHWFEPIKANEFINSLAQLGVVILLFQIGLESNIKQMSKVGLKAFLVAVVGVIVPFVTGWYFGPMLIEGMSQNAAIFLGATLTATSVGITARVFKDLGALKSKEAQIVLGAAVFDDIMGLMILAVVSAIVTVGAASLGMISIIAAKAIGFLVGSILVGQALAPFLSKVFARISTGVAMKFSLVIVFGLLFAAVAKLMGLEPIIGAFAAGLILDPVHFRYFKDHHVVDDVKKAVYDLDPSVQEKVQRATEPHSHRHIEDLIEPVGHFLVPIFFVLTGMSVNLSVLANLPVVLIALIITVIAFIGKLVAGFAAGKGVNKWTIGFGMVPRGEVGLIFAMVGRGLGVVNDTIFSVVVIMVILTTLLPPPILTSLIKKQKAKAKEQAA